jgi:S1-C subfamily serine protease
VPPRESEESLFLQRRSIEWARIPREGGVIFFDLRLRPAGTAISNGASPTPSTGDPVASTVTVSSGTAFLVHPQFVISAGHIVEDSTKLLVTVNGLGDIEATIAARDFRNDICLLKLAVPINDNKPLQFAEPDSLEIGEPVYLLGFS